jgi:hypothetical protein
LAIRNEYISSPLNGITSLNLVVLHNKERRRRTLYEPGVHVGRRDAGADALHAWTIRPGLAGQVPLAGATGAGVAATACAIGRTALASSSAQSSIAWSAFAQG